MKMKTQNKKTRLILMKWMRTVTVKIKPKKI